MTKRPADDSDLDEATDDGAVPPEAGARDAAPAPAADPAAERVAALEDRIKRMQADFLNETRRIRTQADSDRGFAIQRVVVDLLPVLDALHGAASSLAADPAAATFREGYELVERQLHEVLARHGVTPIEAVGKPFDPAQHEAVMLVDRADLPPQTVVDVVRPGFALNGRVVRPAHVTVSRQP
jgi:molecular chaperone GrpE